jgi:uncharacterized protein (DUF1778 family)
MAKNDPIGVRLEPDQRAALEQAAARDSRTLSAMVRKIIADWLSSGRAANLRMGE